MDLGRRDDLLPDIDFEVGRRDDLLLVFCFVPNGNDGAAATGFGNNPERLSFS